MGITLKSYKFLLTLSVACISIQSDQFCNFSFLTLPPIYPPCTRPSETILTQGSTLAVARWPGATRNWCRATKLSKKVTFWWPDRATKLSRWWCDENNIIRSRILPPFTSDRKSKHPTFILASYGGAEYYRHSFPTVKANTRHLF